MADEKLADIQDINDQTKAQLDTCNALSATYSGQLTLVEDGHATSVLNITNELVSDSQGLAHNGFIYSAASYLAQIVLKKDNVFIIQSRIHYLAPVKVGDSINFEATSRLENTRRPEIIVKAHVRDVCVFDGLFYVLCTDEHVLKLQQGELKRYQANKKEANS